MGRITYYGHSAFLLELDYVKLLIDPWITNPISPVKSVQEVTKDIDYILVTHSHSDHLGDTEEIMTLNEKVKLVAIYELAMYIARRVGENRVVPVNIGGSVKLGDIKVVFTEALHSSGYGSPAGVVVLAQEARVYHAGDTGVTMNMRLVGELYKPDIALLPIGGHFTMGPLEAAKAVELIRPKVVIPMHYKTFPVLEGAPEEFVKLVEERCLPSKVVVLSPGSTYEFDFRLGVY
ncbi:MAG: metal-dependent hydrolase [Acidilobaceae archaeon]